MKKKRKKKKEYKKQKQNKTKGRSLTSKNIVLTSKKVLFIWLSIDSINGLDFMEFFFFIVMYDKRQNQ